eukprot:ANDGO_03840.mRNA.1 hypothetical protein
MDAVSVLVPLGLWGIVLTGLAYTRNFPSRGELLERRFFDAFQKNLTKQGPIEVFLLFAAAVEAFYVISIFLSNASWKAEFAYSGYPYRVIGAYVVVLLSCCASHFSTIVDSIAFDVFYLPVLFELIPSFVLSYDDSVAWTVVSGLLIGAYTFVAQLRRPISISRMQRTEFVGMTAKYLYAVAYGASLTSGLSLFGPGTQLIAVCFLVISTLVCLNYVLVNSILDPQPSICNSVRQAGLLAISVALLIGTIIRFNVFTLGSDETTLVLFGAALFTFLCTGYVLCRRRFVDPTTPIRSMLAVPPSPYPKVDIKILFRILSQQRVLDLMLADPDWFDVFRALDSDVALNHLMEYMTFQDSRLPRATKIMMMHLLCIAATRSTACANRMRNLDIPDRLFILAGDQLDETLAECFLTVQFSQDSLSDFDAFGEFLLSTETALRQSCIIAFYRILLNMLSPPAKLSQTFLLRRFTLSNVGDTFAIPIGKLLRPVLIPRFLKQVSDETIPLNCRKYVVEVLILLAKDSRSEPLTRQLTLSNISSFSRLVFLNSGISPSVFEFLAVVFARFVPETTSAIEELLPLVPIETIRHPNLLLSLSQNDVLSRKIADNILGLVFEGLQDLEAVTEAVVRHFPAAHVSRLYLLFTSDDPRVQISAARVLGTLYRCVYLSGFDVGALTSQVFPRPENILQNNESSMSGKDFRIAALNYAFSVTGVIPDHTMAFEFANALHLPDFVRNNMAAMIIDNATFARTKGDVQPFTNLIIQSMLSNANLRTNGLKILLALVGTTIDEDLVVHIEETSAFRSAFVGSQKAVASAEGIFGDRKRGLQREQISLLSKDLQLLLDSGAFVLDYSVDPSVSEEDVLMYMHFLSALLVAPVACMMFGRCNVLLFHNYMSVLGLNVASQEIQLRLLYAAYSLSLHCDEFVSMAFDTCIVDYLMYGLKLNQRCAAVALDTILVLSQKDARYRIAFLSSDMSIFFNTFSSDEGDVFRHAGRLFESWILSSELQTFTAFINSTSLRARSAFLVIDESHSKSLQPKTHRFSYCFAHLSDASKQRFCTVLLDNLLAHTNDTVPVDAMFSAYVFHAIAATLPLSKDLCARLVRCMGFLKGEARYIMALSLYATQAHVEVKDRLYDFQFIRFVVNEWQVNVASQKLKRAEEDIEALNNVSSLDGTAPGARVAPLILTLRTVNRYDFSELFLSAMAQYGLWREMVEVAKIIPAFLGKSLAKVKVLSYFVAKRKDRTPLFETAVPSFLIVLDPVWGSDVQLWEYAYSVLQIHDIRTPAVADTISSVFDASAVENCFRADKSMQIENLTHRLIAHFFGSAKARDEKFANFLCSRGVADKIIQLSLDISSRWKSQELVTNRWFSLYCLSRNKTVCGHLIEQTALLNLIARCFDEAGDAETDDELLALGIITSLIETDIGHQSLCKHRVWDLMKQLKEKRLNGNSRARVDSFLSNHKARSFIVKRSDDSGRAGGSDSPVDPNLSISLSSDFGTPIAEGPITPFTSIAATPSTPVNPLLPPLAVDSNSPGQKAYSSLTVPLLVNKFAASLKKKSIAPISQLAALQQANQLPSTQPPNTPPPAAP